MRRKVVFISYVWEDEEHKAWVLKLAHDLKRWHGIQVLLDQIELSVGKNLTHFMTSSLAIADKVLVILSPMYQQKALQGAGGGGFESSIISQELYSLQTANDKFLPVLRRGDLNQSAPGYLRTLVYLDMKEDGRYEADLFKLGRIINEAPIIEEPLLGDIPDYTNKRAADPVLAISKSLRAKEDIELKRLGFLGSVEGVQAADREIVRLFTSLEDKSREYHQETGYFFRVEKDYEQLALWAEERCGVHISWRPHYQNTTSESTLVVRYYETMRFHFDNGHFCTDGPSDNPTNRTEYWVDVASDLKTMLWRVKGKEEGISSDDLEQEIFLWAINRIVAVKDQKTSARRDNY